MYAMKPVMDRETAEHFYAWLEKTVHISEQHDVEQGIHAILREHPELVEKGYSWPEIGNMAGVWSI
jgi:hypothetical protein